MRRTIKVGIVMSAICLILMGMGAWLLANDELSGTPADPGTPAPASVALTSDERAFYVYVGRRLRAVTAESETLVALGQARSRNIFELRRRGDRVDQIASQIDEFVQTNGVPTRFDLAFSHYAAGIEAVRTADAATRSALTSFDWDAIGRAVEVMAGGTQRLRLARDMLEQDAGDMVDGSPVSA